MVVNDKLKIEDYQHSPSSQKGRTEDFVADFQAPPAQCPSSGSSWMGLDAVDVVLSPASIPNEWTDNSLQKHKADKLSIHFVKLPDKRVVYIKCQYPFIQMISNAIIIRTKTKELWLNQRFKAPCQTLVTFPFHSVSWVILQWSVRNAGEANQLFALLNSKKLVR